MSLLWAGIDTVRIASKINAALFGAFVCGTFATYVSLQSTIRPRFDEIERSHAHMNHKRVMDAIDASTEKLKIATQDYAFWDTTYDAMHGTGVEEFIASNLSPGLKAVENLGVNALVFQKTDGNVMWGGAIDLETKESIDGLVREINHFVRSHRYMSGTSVDTKRGLMRSSKGLLLVAITPIVKTDRSGVPAGKVIAATLFDVDSVKALTHVDFSIEQLPPAFGALNLSDGIELKTLDNEIQTKSLINNVIGRPLVYLNVSSGRDVSQAGSHAIHSALAMMILAALASLVVLWAILRQLVVSRIELLKTHFATAGLSGTIMPIAPGNSRDEIGVLAQSFNLMADQVNHLRDAVADGAYMSGLSEWAAGTLHNVRNGLVPVTSTTWQVEQLYEGTWVKNIEVAALQHADAATTPERRAKLNAFLVGSASRLVEAAKQTTELTGTINSASKSILDMVSEFERYAHRKTEIEAIELLPLVEAVASSTIASRTDSTDLVLPASSAMILGNGIILRQILSNVFVNAIEAIESQKRRGRIEVSITSGYGEARFTRVAISDNGEGLAPDQLDAIFKRGVSTRQHRSGGLGLHWCANAIKVLGGNICAQSRGPGLGVTILIDLPNLEENKKEAA